MPSTAWQHEENKLNYGILFFTFYNQRSSHFMQFWSKWAFPTIFHPIGPQWCTRIGSKRKLTISEESEGWLNKHLKSNYIYLYHHEAAIRYYIKPSTRTRSIYLYSHAWAWGPKYCHVPGLRGHLVRRITTGAGGWVRARSLWTRSRI